MKRILFLICLLIAFSSLSQTEPKVAKEVHATPSILTFNLLSPFSPYNPRYRLGYIKGFSERWRAGLDIGYGSEAINFFSIGENVGEDYQLFEIRPEVYFILNPANKVKQHISLELFYIDQKETLIDNNCILENDNRIQFDRADFHRKKIGTHLKYGAFLPITRKFGVNAYAGLGIKYRDNTFSNIINPRSGGEFLDEFSFFERYREEDGSLFSMNFSFGFKLYYLLN